MNEQSRLAAGQAISPLDAIRSRLARLEAALPGPAAGRKLEQRVAALEAAIGPTHLGPSPVRLDQGEYQRLQHAAAALAELEPEHQRLKDELDEATDLVSDLIGGSYDARRLGSAWLAARKAR